MDYEEKLASALEQIADKVTVAPGLKVGPGKSWQDESGDVVLVLMDGGLVYSTVAGCGELTLIEDLVAGRTTDADHKAHAAKLCRTTAAELRAMGEFMAARAQKVAPWEARLARQAEVSPQGAGPDMCGAGREDGHDAQQRRPHDQPLGEWVAAQLRQLHQGVGLMPSGFTLEIVADVDVCPRSQVACEVAP